MAGSYPGLASARTNARSMPPGCLNKLENSLSEGTCARIEGHSPGGQHKKNQF
jgi:hypothetical protein